MRKLPLGLAAGGLTLMLSAGQAHAATGNGSYTGGYEVPSESVTFAQGVVCGTFHTNNGADPTIHTLPMSGTFGEPGNDSGTATFTITNDWNAGPSGTFLNNNCSTAGAIEGTLHIEFDDWSCADDEGALYQRTSNTSYTLTGTVVCDDLDTGAVEETPISVTFTGTQVLCGDTGQPACNDPNAGTNLAGTYSWST